MTLLSALIVLSLYVGLLWEKHYETVVIHNMNNIEPQLLDKEGHQRRTFLKAAGVALFGVLEFSYGGGRAEMRRSLPNFSDATERVVFEPVSRGARDEEVVSAVRQVAEATTDFSWLSRGDTVFIKVAANSANKYPATTSPLAIQGMVNLLREKGASRVIVGDKPGVQSVYQDEKGQRGSSRDILTKNGLHQAALDSGAEVHYFDEMGYDAYFGDRTEHESHWKGELILPNILNQVDHVVLLPRVSRHILAGTTLGLKAAVGWLRDDSRLELHRDGKTFFEKAAEINDVSVLRQKLRLVLSVATKIQTTFGPDKGLAVEPDIGLVFGSESLLAHDMAALGWLLWNREYKTPEGYLSWYRDPYVTYPGAINRLFVGQIWGFREALRAETYDTVPIHSVRTDPVLSRAALIWGGVPRLEMEAVKGRLPENFSTYIMDKATS
jgi:uncharacterized protein (DUF362 family)